jgi:hypothetical protein
MFAASARMRGVGDLGLDMAPAPVTFSAQVRPVGAQDEAGRNSARRTRLCDLVRSLVLRMIVIDFPAKRAHRWWAESCCGAHPPNDPLEHPGQQPPSGPAMTEIPVELDMRRGMAAQKATELRRLLSEVAANEEALRARQTELEDQLLASPALSWEEAAEKARYLLSLFASSLAGQDPRRQMLIARLLEDFVRLTAAKKS